MSVTVSFWCSFDCVKCLGIQSLLCFISYTIHIPLSFIDLICCNGSALWEEETIWLLKVHQELAFVAAEGKHWQEVDKWVSHDGITAPVLPLGIDKHLVSKVKNSKREKEKWKQINKEWNKIHREKMTLLACPFLILYIVFSTVSFHVSLLAKFLLTCLLNL